MLLLMGCVGFCIASIAWRLSKHGGSSNVVQFIIGFTLLPFTVLMIVMMLKHLIFEYVCTIQKHNIKVIPPKA